MWQHCFPGHSLSHSRLHWLMPLRDDSMDLGIRWNYDKSLNTVSRGSVDRRSKRRLKIKSNMSIAVYWVLSEVPLWKVFVAHVLISSSTGLRLSTMGNVPLTEWEGRRVCYLTSGIRAFNVLCLWVDRMRRRTLKVLIWGSILFS